MLLGFLELHDSADIFFFDICHVTRTVMQILTVPDYNRTNQMAYLIHFETSVHSGTIYQLAS